MEIGKATMQAQPLKVPQKKPDTAPSAMEKPTTAADKPVTAEAGLTLKAQMVEMLLRAKKEAKAEFATQGGMSQRVAAQEQGLDLATLTYNGKPLSELRPEEAQSLIVEDGYFGVDKTAQRIAEFVLSGGGDNLVRLQAGRDGVLQGFAEAEKAWGGTLPEISYQTLNKTLELIDARIAELGSRSILDITA